MIYPGEAFDPGLTLQAVTDERATALRVVPTICTVIAPYSTAHKAHRWWSMASHYWLFAITTTSDWPITLR